MKAVKRQYRWEKVLERYFAAHGVPLRWDGHAKRFTGLAGHLFARIDPYSEDNVWARMPMYVRRYNTERNPTGKQVAVLVTNNRYGDSVDDTLVVMRLGTLLPMMHALYSGDRERWTE